MCNSCLHPNPLFVKRAKEEDKSSKVSMVIFAVMMLIFFIIIATYLGIGAHYWVPLIRQRFICFGVARKRRPFDFLIFSLLAL